MKKRLLALLLVVVSCVTFTVACSDSEEDKETGEYGEILEQAKGTWQQIKEETDKKNEARAKLVEKNKKSIEGTVLSTSKGDIEITAYSVIRTEVLKEECDVVYLFLKYTNKDEFDSIFPDDYFAVYQNGIELDSSLDIDKELLTAIQNGASIEIYKPYVLRDNKTDVQIKYDLYDEKSEYILKIK